MPAILQRAFGAVLMTAVTIALAACAGGGSTVNVHRAAVSTPSFAIPPRPLAAVPRAPSFAVPPAPQRLGPGPLTNATGHSVFFTGEANLGSGVFYLAFPNSNVYGYYSYLSDPHYVFHFDMGYWYVFDSQDANNVYVYDFSTGDYWYTGQTLFPYVYDFTLQSFLYYYPDTNQAGHYSKNPRWFFNYQTQKIIQLPAPSISLDLNIKSWWGNHANSASSYAITLVVKDVNGHELARHTQPENEQPGNTGNGVLTSNTDEIAASYPQGQGATYEIIINNPPTVTNPCTLSNGTGAIVDNNNANAYATVTQVCN